MCNAQNSELTINNSFRLVSINNQCVAFESVSHGKLKPNQLCEECHILIGVVYAPTQSEKHLL